MTRRFQSSPRVNQILWLHGSVTDSEAYSRLHVLKEWKCPEHHLTVVKIILYVQIEDHYVTCILLPLSSIYSYSLVPKQYWNYFPCKPLCKRKWVFYISMKLLAHLWVGQSISKLCKLTCKEQLKILHWLYCLPYQKSHWKIFKIFPNIPVFNKCLTSIMMSFRNFFRLYFCCTYRRISLFYTMKIMRNLVLVTNLSLIKVQYYNKCSISQKRRHHADFAKHCNNAEWKSRSIMHSYGK